MWDLPAGKNCPGEPVTETAVRELREETGLEVAPGALRVAHVIHGAHAAEGPNGYLCVVFAADTWHGEPVNREPHKHDELRWFPVTEPPDPLVPSNAEALRAYLGERPDERPLLSLRGWSG